MKKNSKLSLYIAAAAFVALFVVRLLLLTGGTDRRTGFLLDENGFFINFSYYGLLILTAAALIAVGVISKKKSTDFHTCGISEFSDLKAVLLGFPLLMAGALTMYEGYMQVRSITPSSFLIFTEFIFGAAMALTAFVILFLQRMPPALGFALTLPAIYYTLRGIGIFLDRMVVAAIPEYLIEALSFIGFAIFFMQLAKLMTGNESRSTRIIVSVTGLTTSVMTLSSAFATIVADIIAPDALRIYAHANIAELEHQRLCAQYSFDNYCMAYTSWADVLIAVCMLLTVIALHLPSKAKTQTEPSDTTE